MRKITEDFEDLLYNWEGIIVGVPTQYRLCCNADMYIFKRELSKTNDWQYFISAYNMEDGTINGFSHDWAWRFDDITEVMTAMNLEFYQFENLTEFCEWYIHKDDEQKEFIKAFKDSVKEAEEKLGITITTRRDVLKDVLTLLELRDLRQNTLDCMNKSKDAAMLDHLCKQYDRDCKRIEEFLDEEV